MKSEGKKNKERKQENRWRNPQGGVGLEKQIDNSKMKKGMISCFYLVAFLVPIVVMLAVYWKQGFYPFGEKTVLIMDMKGQYVEFFASLRNLFGGDDSLTFSWSRSLGGGYLGLFAYYVASPLSFLTIFFSLEKMPLAVWLLTLLKIGLCSVSFLAFARYHAMRGNRRENLQKKDVVMAELSKNGVLVLLAVGYGLISYNMVYSLCLMWLDGVILLPAVLLGVEKLLEENRKLPYILSLAALFVCNYYTAYMVGIFTALYFIYQCVLRLNGDNLKKLLFKAVHFTVSTILAFGLAAPLLLPLVKELMAGNMSGQNYIPAQTTNFEFSAFFGKLFRGGYDSITNAGLPAVYCGLISLILAALFFFLPRIKWREKFGALLILGVLVCSFYFTKLDIAWHAFRYPNWFPYRYAFLFSFFILFLACRAVCTVCNIISWNQRRRSVFALIVVLLLFSVQCIDLQKNSAELLAGLDQEFYYGSFEEYQTFLQKTEPLVKAIQTEDQGIYRINQGYEYSKNDAMLLGYNGMTHYSSTYNKAINEFTKKFGLAQAYYWNSGYGSTPLMDSLLGVKYNLEDGVIPGCYNLFTQSEGAAAYENPLFLPFAYSAPVTDENPDIQEGDPFYNQNRLLNTIANTQESYLTGVTYTEAATENGWSYTFEPEADQPVYLFMRADALSWADIYVNGGWVGNYFSNETNCSLYLGTFSQGEQVTVECIPSASIQVTGVYLYQLNTSLLSADLSTLSDGGIEIGNHGGGKIHGKIRVGDGEKIMTSIPYDQGWTVEIDGKKVETKEFAGTFLMVETTSGVHEITFAYHAPGLAAGGALFVFSVVVICLYCGIFRATKKKSSIQ